MFESENEVKKNIENSMFYNLNNKLSISNEKLQAQLHLSSLVP